MTLVADHPTAPLRLVDREERCRRGRARQRTALLTVAAVTAGALGLRDAAARSADYDEALTLRLAETSWSQWTQVVVDRELDDAAWHLLVRLLGAVTGDSLPAARALSAACVVGAVLVVGLIGARVTGARRAAAAAVLVAVHPAVADAARAADGRGAALLATCAALLLLDRAVAGEARSRASWCGFLAAAAAASCFSPVALPITATAFVLRVSWKRSWTRRTRLVAGAFAALHLPLVAAALLGRLADSGLVAAGRLQGHVASRSLELLGGGAPWRVPVLVVLLLAFAAASLRRTALSWPVRGTGTDAVLLGWVLAPLAMGAVVGLAAPVLRPELLVVTVPALALITSELAARCRDRRVGVVAVVVVLASLLPGALVETADGDESDWRRVVRTITAQASSGDQLVVLPTYDQVPLGLAIDEQDLEQVMPPLPGRSEGWDALPLDAAVQEPLAQPLQAERIWLVVPTAAPGLVRSTSPALEGRQRTFDEVHGEVRVLRFE